jgi:ATP-dependent Clp protease ATP-binding subunit ClpA
MNVTVPVYVESVRQGGNTLYKARPLFFPGPIVRGERLERLLSRLMQDIGEVLTGLGREARHDALVSWTFAPRLAHERLEVTLLLRRRTVRCRYLFVSFRQLGRRIVFTPSVPDVWFELARGERLLDRATEVLTKHYRDLERDDEEVHPEQAALSGTAQVMPLELTIHPPVKPPEPPVQRFLMLGTDQRTSGAAELRRVGRCLDWQYPDDLEHAVLRDAELADLTRLLTDAENRPVLLLGPRQVGKTALLHEYVRQEVRQRPSPFRDRRNVWQLAPARLISGMMYVGQWEDRLLAIVKEARKREHLLYFDDLLGLFLAGQSSASSLSVADVLKPYLERRQVRVVAEITPEAFRVLREKDRGFADLFHILPISEPSEAETLHILLAVQRELENKHRCEFELEVLPTVIDLQRRFGRDLAFPGKAATLLHQLAVKHANTAAGSRTVAAGEKPTFESLFGKGAISRHSTLLEFAAQTGLQFTFLDRDARLERQSVINALARQVVGQEAAVQAAADVIGIAKARLNDPDRPLATFLFLGPTGVGKTQSAKALAAYLFGDPERLLRFDLNEYAVAGAAARLVGTFSQPEGHLTSAIRRQPFAVVLFDEVEKAHPEVFDLLLQVLGEGRLTDALGRTADFSNALIVLTSNLGVRESEGHLGLRSDEAARDALFVQAAERFFRPEFFNRLDRVLPFHRLTRAQVGDVAQRLIDGVFTREGLAQRKSVLAVEPAALAHIVDQGFDPVLGARALKRAIERELTQPVARQLAALPPGQLTIVRVLPGPGQLQVRVEALEDTPAIELPAIDFDDGPELLKRVRAALRRIETILGKVRPEGPVTVGQVSAEQYRYFALREQLETVRVSSQSLSARYEASHSTAFDRPAYPRPDRPRPAFKKRYSESRGGFLRELAASLDINEFLHELAGSTAAPTALVHELQELLRQVALLELIANCVETEPPVQRVLLLLRPIGPHLPAEMDTFAANLEVDLIGVGLTCTEVTATELGHTSDTYLFVEGLHAWPVANQEAGVHLFCPAHAALAPLQLVAVPLADGVDPWQAIAAAQGRQTNWLAAVARGAAAEEPYPLGRVVRVYDDRKGAFDLRSRLHGPADQLAGFLLAGLPLPPEILE